MRPDWGYYGTYDESAYPDLWNGVVNYWAPCLGPTGLRLHDVSRSNSWGTLTDMDAATDWTVSSGQYALDFDGSNDYVTMGNQAAYFQSTDAFMFAFWVKVNSFVANGGVLARANAGERGYHVRTLSTSRLRWIVYSTGDNFYGVDTSVLTAGVWYSVVASFFSGTSRLFLNGVEQTTTVIGLPVGSLTQDFPFEIGRLNAVYGDVSISDLVAMRGAASVNFALQFHQLGRGGMLQRRSRRRAYSFMPGINIPILTARNSIIGGGTI